ncbi:MAG: Nudix family hydrolase [Candidatus Accumulibacter sp.]|nr:Nudix family hydrolase [Accumulibacter sp.]
MLPTVDVSAGVLLRETGAGVEYLLARRPPGKVYAGYWEFPGGKVEPGESFHDALARELAEELGIAVTAATPWLYREFTYPHAYARLKFFRVTGWRGEIDPREHTGVAWTRLDETPAVAPLLPANGPILRALALPAVYAIVHAGENGVDVDAGLERIHRALARGVRLLQIHGEALAADELHRFAEKAAALAAAVPGTLLLVGDDETLARNIGARGVHLSPPRLRALARRPDFDWLAASCRDAADLARAERLGADFAVLGPVPPTTETPGIGWQAFARRIERATIPVFAPGDMRPESIATAQTHGAHGIALPSDW